MRLYFNAKRWIHNTIILMLLLFLVQCNHKKSNEPISLENISTQTDVLLQAFEHAPDGTLWVSGHQSTYGWATKPYTDWTFNQIMDIDTLLQFRDLAVTNEALFLMSAGNGDQSRIYRSTDAGQNWQEVYRAEEEAIFLDSIDFFDDQNGLAYGDSIDGTLFILETKDGGLSWKRISPENLPDALEGEGGFASSGSCIEVIDEQTAFIATGNAATSRLLITLDQGNTWKVKELDLIAGSAAGATGVHVDNDGYAWVYGGDLNSAQTAGNRIQRYHIPTDSLYVPNMFDFDGALYGLSTRTNTEDSLTVTDWLVAANPNGLFVSSIIQANHSVSPFWLQIDSLSYWAVVSVENHIFAAGPDGRMKKISLTSQNKPVLLSND